MATLAGKIAVVTGAERGIGRAIALRLAADGAEVYINYPAAAGPAEGVATEILADGGRAQAVRADIADATQVARMFAGIPRVDLLVNNAGIGVPALLPEITEQMLDSIFAVNVKGMVFCAQQAVTRMSAGGRIINISSSTTNFPIPGISVYTASKAAVRAFTEVWAKELGGRGINVNSVMPGPTSPGMADLAPPEVREAVKRASPFGRLGAADEIAAVVAFLCGEDARWISGQHLLVNGAASA
jgi:3-oxoacyl-[acyl-carrier protein] reductase